MASKIYALYDDNDQILGTYTRNELKELLKMNEKTFVCEMWRIKKGKRDGVYYKGQHYKVFVYEEEE